MKSKKFAPYGPVISDERLAEVRATRYRDGGLIAALVGKIDATESAAYTRGLEDAAKLVETKFYTSCHGEDLAEEVRALKDQKQGGGDE